MTARRSIRFCIVLLSFWVVLAPAASAAMATMTVADAHCVDAASCAPCGNEGMVPQDCEFRCLSVTSVALAAEIAVVLAPPQPRYAMARGHPPAERSFKIEPSPPRSLPN